MFRAEANAREASEREARALKRRMVETRVVEAWSKALTNDSGNFMGVYWELSRAIREGGALDLDLWPIRRHAPPSHLPVVVGPLRSPLEIASSALSKLHSTLEWNIGLHRKGNPPEYDIELQREAFSQALKDLNDALRVELTALTLPAADASTHT